MINPFASREVAEYDWVLFGKYGDILHAPKKYYDPYYNAYDPNGCTVCGRRGWLQIPGIATRMAAKRCDRCCDLTLIPRGHESPKNDPACRPVVLERVLTLQRTYWTLNIIDNIDLERLYGS